MNDSRETGVLLIDERTALRWEELQFHYSRAGGPGGQNVNKVSTRVTLRFDVTNSPSLTGEQRDRIRRELRTRVTRDGVLHVTSSKHRTQAANRRAATQRFIELLTDVLKPDTPRRPTGVPRRSRERRLTEKAKRSQAKQSRRYTSHDD